jgi:hypothetical protein
MPSPTQLEPVCSSGSCSGKPLGITAAVWLALRLGVADGPAAVTWRHLHGAAWLCGIGFTMSLFIANLPFESEAALDTAKLGVLSASLIAGIVGWMILRSASQEPAEPASYRSAERESGYRRGVNSGPQPTFHSMKHNNDFHVSDGPHRRIALTALLGCLALTSPLSGQNVPRLEVELEAGPVWQTRNDVQIPNDQMGTRFSLIEPLGRGPVPAGRLYVSWNFNDRHAARILLAPLSVTGTGPVNGPIAFAGETFSVGADVRATYQFNSYRLSYRYRLLHRDRLNLWAGFTAKIRDAKVELQQGSTTARDTDVGLVPLLHLAAGWRVSSQAHVLFDLDGLAGGPGRAFDAALKVGFDLNDTWRVSGGYRTVEGGADVTRVYAFAWLHYGTISMTYRY